MKAGIKLIALWSIAMSLCGCGTHKRSTASQEHASAQAEVSKRDTSSTAVENSVVEAADAFCIIEETVITYDTGKPADSITGRPPVQQEKKRIVSKGNQKQRQQYFLFRYNQAAEADSTAQQEIVIHEAKQTTCDTASVPLLIMVWLPVALIIVGWLIYRCRRK